MRVKYQRAPITADWTVGAAPNTGDGILAAEKLGAALELTEDAWWGRWSPLPNDPCLRCRDVGVVDESPVDAVVLSVLLAKAKTAVQGGGNVESRTIATGIHRTRVAAAEDVGRIVVDAGRRLRSGRNRNCLLTHRPPNSAAHHQREPDQASPLARDRLRFAVEQTQRLIPLRALGSGLRAPPRSRTQPPKTLVESTTSR
jgi:hypothetical protein